MLRSGGAGVDDFIGGGSEVSIDGGDGEGALNSDWEGLGL